MRNSVKVCASIVAMMAMAQNALAGEGCVRHREMVALETAALQQKLMVAALSCHAIRLYNRFVISYRRDLQRSDNELKAFFIRHGSVADYHAFKTRLANNSSLASIGDTDSYCRNAYEEFDEALSTRRHSLRALVADLHVRVDAPYEDCRTEMSER
jgi:hypothetical protein